MLSSRARPLVPLLLSTFAAFGAIAARAAPGAALQIEGSLAYGHDDNLLRIADGRPAFDGHRGDAWWTREAGLLFDRTYGRQRLALVARLSKTSFDHFRQLDHDGKDLQAEWAWQLGNRLEGKLGASLQQVLAPYTDFSSSERNLRRVRTRHAEGGWRLHPAWRLRAGLQRDKTTYEALGNRFNDRTEVTHEVELDYLPRSGSTVGLVARRIEGSYPVVRPSGPLAFDHGYTQDELKARVEWRAGGALALDALAGFSRRSRSGAGRTSGLAGRIAASYQPRGKVVARAAVWRDFAPLESTLVSYTRNTGASLGARWDATASIALDAEARAERRHYGARRAVADTGELRDALRSASMILSWRPRPALLLQGGMAHQARSGAPALGTGAFGANSVTLTASVRF